VSGSGQSDFRVAAVYGSYAIDKDSSMTMVTVANAAYDGSPRGVTAIVTGAGGLNQSLTVSYSGRNGTVYGPSTTSPSNAGDYTASASFGGDANHDGSNDSKNYSITKALVTATAGSGSATYDGTSKSPLACVVSGTYTGDLTCANSPASVGPGAGTTTIYPVVSGTGLDNFQITKFNGSYTINKATQTIVFGALAKTLFGDPDFPVSATAPSGLTVAFSSQTTAKCTISGSTVHIVAAGTCTIRASQAGDANYYAAPNVDQSLTIGAWNLTGFYQPVDMTTTATIVYNTVKGGSTVPFKFNVYAGSIEQASTSAVKSIQSQQFVCSAGYDADIPSTELSATGGTVLRYDTTGRQFIYNWQTAKHAGDCFRVTMTAQ